ncbi:MAG TPA: hypothetical protein ENI23_00525 [bacterium]|nr:hypothetical protein [bacterium]
MPLARTPQSRQGVQAMRNYSKKLENSLDSLTPWTTSSRFSALRRRYGGKMPEGSQVVVEFDANDNPDSALYEGSNKPEKDTSKAENK